MIPICLRCNKEMISSKSKSNTYYSCDECVIHDRHSFFKIEDEKITGWGFSISKQYYLRSLDGDYSNLYNVENELYTIIYDLYKQYTIIQVKQFYKYPETYDDVLRLYNRIMKMAAFQ